MKIMKNNDVQVAYDVLRKTIARYEQLDKESPAFLQCQEALISCFEASIEVVRRELYFCQSAIIAMASQIKAISDRKISKNELREDIEKIRGKQISLSNLLVKIKNKAVELDLAGKIESMNNDACQDDDRKRKHLFDEVEKYS